MVVIDRGELQEREGAPAPAHRQLSIEERYLELMKQSLTRFIFEDTTLLQVPPREGWRGRIEGALERWLLRSRNAELLRAVPFDPSLRIDGRDWPTRAETMVGLKRLNNLQCCIKDVLVRGVPGDLIETGVWRGGSTIFMRAALEAYGDTSRVVWVADSFKGLPKPNEADFPADRGDTFWTHPELAIPLEQVKANFEKYGLLDDRVQFLVGWFKDTLPAAPIERLAVLRLDGDMYESTMQALDSLYPKLSAGGYVIVDDYGAVEGCRTAVSDYLRMNGIAARIREIDWTGVYWQK